MSISPLDIYGLFVGCVVEAGFSASFGTCGLVANGQFIVPTDLAQVKTTFNCILCSDASRVEGEISSCKNQLPAFDANTVNTTITNICNKHMQPCQTHLDNFLGDLTSALPGIAAAIESGTNPLTAFSEFLCANLADVNGVMASCSEQKDMSMPFGFCPVTGLASGVASSNFTATASSSSPLASTRTASVSSVAAASVVASSSATDSAGGVVTAPATTETSSDLKSAAVSLVGSLAGVFGVWLVVTIF
ncbi:hypothetical protein HDU98_009728 [Podochytrium sp. JEL0797]|nr:hypothetical protein HDU98_009728 [Podochytrium sp. JEL0797]